MQRVVNNYNAKVKRVTDKNPELSDFYPDKVSVRDLKKSEIYSRKDLTQVLKRLQRFSQRGAEKIVRNEKGEAFTRYEVENIKKENRLRNLRRTLQRKKLGLDLEKDRRKIYEMNLQPKKINFDTISRKSFEKANEQLERELLESNTIRQMERYKENYLNAIRESLGAEGDRLVELLEGVDPLKLREALLNENLNTFIKMSFTYAPEEKSAKSEAIYNEWSRILNSS